MGEVRIYKLDLSPVDFEFSTGSPPETYQSSDWGGDDAPLADYPEFAELENVKRSEGAGASGQDVVDSADGDYIFSWVTMAGIGNLINGQFDCRGGGVDHPIKIRWKQFLKSSALAEADYSAPLIVSNGGVGGTGTGLFSHELFMVLEMVRETGADFQWNVGYWSVNGGGTLFQFKNLNPGLTGYPGTADDAEHEMIVTIVPSTVTGSFDASTPAVPNPVGSTVASDGSIDVTLDGVSVISGTTLQCVVNKYGVTSPNVYYAKTLWHGD